MNHTFICAALKHLQQVIICFMHKQSEAHRSYDSHFKVQYCTIYLRGTPTQTSLFLFANNIVLRYAIQTKKASKILIFDEVMEFQNLSFLSVQKNASSAQI